MTASTLDKGPVTEPAAPIPRPIAELTVSEIMCAPVITVSTNDDLWTAWGLIYRAGFRHLIVLEGTRCVGVLDDRRIVLTWPLGPLGQKRTQVGDVVARGVHSVLGDTPVSVIARIMLDERTDAVPVVNGRGDIVGLVTAEDLLRLLTAG